MPVIAVNSREGCFVKFLINIASEGIDSDSSLQEYWLILGEGLFAKHPLKVIYGEIISDFSTQVYWT